MRQCSKCSEQIQHKRKYAWCNACSAAYMRERRAAGIGLESAEYAVWLALRARCTNPNHPAWKNYGGRGITVCARWMVFENFLADMGVRPDGLSLDRINNDGNYELSNCRWATWHQQANNRRSNGSTKKTSLKT